MGTRCLTRVFDGDEELCCIYRHFDGYPGGHGADLEKWLGGMRVVNGYSSAASIPKERMLNGAGSAAAFVISRMQRDGVSPSVMLPGTKGVWEEYEYHVKCPSIEDIRRAGDPADGLGLVIEMFSVRERAGEPRRLERVGDDAEEPLRDSNDVFADLLEEARSMSSDIDPIPAVAKALWKATKDDPTKSEILQTLHSYVMKLRDRKRGEGPAR